MALARRFCADEGDAEELVNRTFAAVIEGIDDYVEQSAFFGWMCQILVNLHTVDVRRKSNRTVVCTGDIPDVADVSATDRIFLDVDAGLLREAICQLPPEMEQSVVMHYLMGLSVGQVAKFLTLPVSTVHWRLRCARHELARRLGVATKKPGAHSLLVALACAAAVAGAAVTAVTAIPALVGAFGGDSRATPPEAAEASEAAPITSATASPDSSLPAESAPSTSSDELPLGLSDDTFSLSSTPYPQTTMKKSFVPKSLLAAALAAPLALAVPSRAENLTVRTYADHLPGTTEDAVLFEDAHLLAVTGISLDIRNYFGGALKNLTLSNIVADDAGVDGIYHYSNDGSRLEAHFEWKNYGYNFGLLLVLTQSGTDIRGRVAKVCYPGGAYGTDLNNQSSGNCRYFTNEADQEAYKSSSTFSTTCKNLALTFVATESHTVTFVDWNGTILDTQTVAYGADATPPVAPSRSGYVFAGWDTAFTAVTENLTITAVYHQLFTVTFLDADGTVLSTQTVEETTAATEPDMTGHTYGGNPFSGWDADFSSVMGNLTVTAEYAEPPADVAAVIDGGQLPDGALVWGGGASGIWNDSTANWYNLNKVTRPWSAGAVAVFPCAAAVTVSGPKQAGGVLFATDGAVALSGDALTLADGSSVTLNGKFAVVSNDVSSAGAVSFVCNDVDESLRSWKGVLTFDDALLFPGASLADVSNLTLRMKGKFGGERPVATLTTDVDSNGNGIHFYSADGTQISGQAKVKTNNGYGGVWEVIKFVLTEEADGIHGHVEYACGGTGSGGWTADRDMDPVTSRPNSGSNALVTAPEDDTAAWNAAPTYAGALYAISYNVANITYIAPEVQLGGTVACTALTVGENLTVRLVGGGRLGANGTYSGDLTVDGTLAFAGDNAQTIKGKRQGDGRYLVAEGGSAVFDCGSGGSWTDLAIAGNATVNGYWTLPGDKGATRVLPGGIVDLQSFYFQYGPQGGAPLYIHTNGLVRLTKAYSIGRAKPFHAIGGVIAEVLGGAQDQLAQHVYLSNGADFIGTKVGIGDSASDWSVLSVSGETPSFFSVSNLVVGLLGTVNANNKALGGKIAVEDVTGDERTDLTVRSVLQERPNATARYADGFRENCGLWKTGNGTVEFTAAGSCATSGVFKVEAGTVRLANGSSGQYGPFILLDDASLDFQGGTVAFEDSSSYAWTTNATLDITGELKAKSLRFGTDATGLTAAQLEQITFRGRKNKVSLDAEGYLRGPGDGTAFLLR